VADNLLASLAPYRGLRPFSEQDAGLFFGRKQIGQSDDPDALRTLAQALQALPVKLTEAQGSPPTLKIDPMNGREARESGLWQRCRLRHDRPFRK
jgi:hypothetical protein